MSKPRQKGGSGSAASRRRTTRRPPTTAKRQGAKRTTRPPPTTAKRQGAKRTTRPPPTSAKRQGGKQSRADASTSATRSVGRGGGFAVSVRIVEAAGTGREVVERIDNGLKSGGGGGPVGTFARSSRKLKLAGRVSRAELLFAAIGHHARLSLLLRLLEGPATYAELKAHSRLGPGPLYHHLNQLRLAGLILPKRRDDYAISRGGRNALLVGLAAVPISNDHRPREADGKEPRARSTGSTPTKGR